MNFKPPHHMNQRHSRQAGKILEQERVRQKKMAENRYRTLMKKSELLLDLYLKSTGAITTTTTDQQVQAFYQVQARGLTDLQIVIRIDDYEQSLDTRTGIDPVQFCNQIFNHNFNQS